MPLSKAFGKRRKNTMTISFVIGGARSGKSRIAQQLAEAYPGPLLFIATAEAFDAEMRDRITLHQQDRGPRWSTLEAPVNLIEAIRQSGEAGQVLLVDCLTVWLGNLMHHGHDLDVATKALVLAIAESRGPIILVSNEVGQGIVPDNAMARTFRDASGRLNQRIAASADHVMLITAGLVQKIKG